MSGKITPPMEKDNNQTQGEKGAERPLKDLSNEELIEKMGKTLEKLQTKKGGGKGK